MTLSKDESSKVAISVTVSHEEVTQEFYDDLEVPKFGDWQLPLAFTKKRHSEVIEGNKIVTQTWRMKERVCKSTCRLLLSTVIESYTENAHCHWPSFC